MATDRIPVNAVLLHRTTLTGGDGTRLEVSLHRTNQARHRRLFVSVRRPDTWAAPAVAVHTSLDAARRKYDGAVDAAVRSGWTVTATYPRRTEGTAS